MSKSVSGYLRQKKVPKAIKPEGGGGKALMARIKRRTFFCGFPYDDSLFCKCIIKKIILVHGSPPPLPKHPANRFNHNFREQGKKQKYSDR